MAEGQDERISEWSESDELLRWTLEQHTRSLNDDGKWCAQCYTRIPCDIAALAASGLDRSARLDALAAECDHNADTLRRVKGHKDHLESRLGEARDSIEELTMDRDAALARLAAAESANARAADSIMQDVLDLGPDDPEHPDTICISYDALVVVLKNALWGAEPRWPAAASGRRGRVMASEHYPGCWRKHLTCARDTVEFEMARRQRAENALLEILREAAWESRLTEWHKHSVTAVGTQPTPQEACREIRTIARRALEAVGAEAEQ